MVDHGALSNCERPRDGAVCEPTCKRGFTDIKSIECQLVGNTTIKSVGGNEFHPHKWIVQKPGTSRITELTYMDQIVCFKSVIRARKSVIEVIKQFIHQSAIQSFTV